MLIRKAFTFALSVMVMAPVVGFAQAENTTKTNAALEEVIVTAERRAASLQETAASIVAFSGKELADLGVTQPQDLQALTPGLLISPGGPTTQIYIRGVGNFASNAYAEGAVSFNVDGIYISRNTTYSGLFYDLERVEVLKGPQGTLYGRNATGGAINLVSAKPVVGGEVDGYITGELGNFSHKNFNAATNIPLGDTFAMRAAIQVLDRDGFYADGSDDSDSTSARLSGLWTPNDDFSMLVVADFQDVGGSGMGATISNVNPFGSPTFLTPDPWDAGATSPEANAALAAFGRAPLGNPAQYSDLAAWGIMSQMDWNLGIGTLSFIPSYRETDNTYINWSPGFLLDVAETSEQTSAELRLASNEEGFVEWLVGGFYFEEDVDSVGRYLQQLVFLSPGKNSTVSRPVLNDQAWAAFAEVTFNITDSFRAIGGLRYNTEDKTMTGTFSSNPPIPGAPETTLPLVGDKSWNETTWKVGMEYDLADTSMLFFTVGTGFKAGGFFSEQQQYGNSYEPENITAYTLGSKNRFFNDRLQLNLEAFYWDYVDHQESGLSLSPGFYSVFKTENVGQATMQGLELEGKYLITENDLISFQVAYLDATFDEFSSVAFSPAGPPLSGCPIINVGGPFYNVNCNGFEAIRAPELSGTLGYQHTFDMENGTSIVFDVRSQFADSTQTSINYLPAGVADSYTRTDALLSFYSADGHWNVGAWIRNIEDEAVLTSAFVSPFTALNYSTLRPPRTYGISFGYNF